MSSKEIPVAVRRIGPNKPIAPIIFNSDKEWRFTNVSILSLLNVLHDAEVNAVFSPRCLNFSRIYSTPVFSGLTEKQAKMSSRKT